MNAYVDLSIIIFIINFVLSFIYSIIIFDNVKCRSHFIIITFLLSLLSLFINMFVIDYFFIFFFILYSLFIAIFSFNLFKVLLLTLIIFYINYGYLLVIGGCFFYKGLLLVSTPFTCVFILLVPIYITIIHIVFQTCFKRIKDKKFKVKCFVRVDEKLYKGIGYYDTGNNLMHDNKPVIFINDRPFNNNGEVVNVKGINDVSFKYLAYKAKLIIRRKVIDVYVVYISNYKAFNNCKFLLNKHVL